MSTNEVEDLSRLRWVQYVVSLAALPGLNLPECAGREDQGQLMQHNH